MEKNEEVLAVVETTAQQEGERELSTSVNALESRAVNIVIASQVDYQEAAEFGRLIKQRSSQVQEFFAPMKKLAFDAHKQVCEREKMMIAPLVNAEKAIKKAMGEWAFEQERKRKEEEERLRRLAKEEADRKLEEAISATENGDMDRAEEAMNDASIIDQVGRNITIPSASPQADGVSLSTDWELVSVENEKVPVNFAGVELRPVDTKALIRMIRASKGTIQIPGVTFKTVAKMSFRK